MRQLTDQSSVGLRKNWNQNIDMSEFSEKK